MTEQNGPSKQSVIRQKAVEHRIRWSRHALSELVPDTLSIDEVESALQWAVVIEDYPHLHRHWPDCLVLAFVDLDEPIHAVVAINEPRDYSRS
jgi:hypothetical protein